MSLTNEGLLGVGDIYHFGPYDWRVLGVQEDKALLITEGIIEERAYNEEDHSVTWETCFADCVSLTSIIIPNSVKKWGVNAS